MKEPKLRQGFIIFRKGLEQEIQLDSKGHWWTAKYWVEKNHLEKVYEKIIQKSETIDDYDTFLTDYIGAVKLYEVSGVFRCYIPGTQVETDNSEYLNQLKDHYKKLDYVLFGNN